MKFNQMDIDKEITKILGYKTYSDKRKIDALLEMDATLYTNLGIESTKKEKEEVKRASKKIYKAIREVDPMLGSFLLKAGIDV